MHLQLNCFAAKLSRQATFVGPRETVTEGNLLKERSETTFATNNTSGTFNYVTQHGYAVNDIPTDSIMLVRQTALQARIIRPLSYYYYWD